MSNHYFRVLNCRWKKNSIQFFNQRNSNTTAP